MGIKRKIVSITLPLVTSLLASLAIFSPVYADADLGIGFDVPEMHSIYVADKDGIQVSGLELESNPGAFVTGELRAVVSANYNYGYTVTVQDSDAVTSLKDAETSAEIPTLTSSLAQDDFSSSSSSVWGFGVGRNASTFLPMPSSAQTAALVGYTDDLDMENAKSYPITIAIKTSAAQLSGTYVDEIVFSVIPNSMPRVVTYNTNSGAFTDGTTTKTQTITTGNASTQVVTSATPERDNYTFLGWAEDDDATEATYTAGATLAGLSSDKMLYAVWESNGYAYSLTFNGNGGTISTNSGETDTLSGTAASVSLPTATYHTAYTTNTSTRYATFAGWSEEPNATTATYTDTMTISETTTKTLYAVWDFNSGTLQYAAANSASVCGNNMIDARTGVSYLTCTISGACYMEQNLYLPMGKTLYAGDSNIYNTQAEKNKKVSWTTPTADLTAGDSYTEARMHVGTYTNNTYNATGAWYNYCAASAGTVCDKTTQEDAYSDICPKGWMLPTLDQMTNVSSANRTKWKFYAVRYYNGSLQNASSLSYWWSSTAYTATSQYRLNYSSGSVVSTRRRRTAAIVHSAASGCRVLRLAAERPENLTPKCNARFIGAPAKETLLRAETGMLNDAGVLISSCPNWMIPPRPKLRSIS